MSEGENEVHESSGSVWKDLNLPEPTEAVEVPDFARVAREMYRGALVNLGYPAHKIEQIFAGEASTSPVHMDLVMWAERGAAAMQKHLTAELADAHAKLKEQAMAYLALDQQATEAIERAVKAEKERDRLRALLQRYRNEVPLGHQPHMIAGEVEAALIAKEESGA